MKLQRAALGVLVAVVAAVTIWWSQGETSQSQSADPNPTVTASQLPSPTGSVDEGGPFPYSSNGETFHNYGDLLPDHPYGFYHEYTVVTPGVDDRGARRTIIGYDGARYCTSDHYNSFERISL